MGYIYGPAKNSSFIFPVALLTVSDGEAALTPTLAAGDFQISVGGAFGNPATAPTESPVGSGQIIVTLDTSETPGPWTTVRFIDQTGPKVYHDNFWTVFFGNVSSTSGSVITVNPSAFIDAEQVANLVGPYIVNLLTNTLNLPSAGQWDDIIAMATTVDAVKTVTDQFGFTSGRVNANVGAIETAVQTIIKSLVYAAQTDSANQLPQPSVGALPETPTPAQALSALYAQLRNGSLVTGSGSSGTRSLRKADGTTIATATITKSTGSVDSGKLDS